MTIPIRIIRSEPSAATIVRMPCEPRECASRSQAVSDILAIEYNAIMLPVCCTIWVVPDLIGDSLEPFGLGPSTGVFQHDLVNGGPFTHGPRMDGRRKPLFLCIAGISKHSVCLWMHGLSSRSKCALAMLAVLPGDCGL